MKVVSFLLRVLLMVVGLVFFAALLSLAFAVLLFWLLRVLWARLTGQAIPAWRFQMNRQAAWQHFYRKATGSSADRTHTGGAGVYDTDATDITDVEPKKLQER